MAQARGAPLQGPRRRDGADLAGGARRGALPDPQDAAPAARKRLVRPSPEAVGARVGRPRCGFPQAPRGARPRGLHHAGGLARGRALPCRRAGAHPAQLLRRDPPGAGRSLGQGPRRRGPDRRRVHRLRLPRDTAGPALQGRAGGRDRRLPRRARGRADKRAPPPSGRPGPAGPRRPPLPAGPAATTSSSATRPTSPPPTWTRFPRNSGGSPGSPSTAVRTGWDQSESLSGRPRGG